VCAYALSLVPPPPPPPPPPPSLQPATHAMLPQLGNESKGFPSRSLLTLVCGPPRGCTGTVSVCISVYTPHLHQHRMHQRGFWQQVYCTCKYWHCICVYTPQLSIYVRIYGMCMCVCVCVHARAREWLVGGEEGVCITSVSMLMSVSVSMCTSSLYHRTR
jgi:hypothetical protein